MSISINAPLTPFFNFTNGTSVDDHTEPVYLGFIAAMISVIFFGTAFLPLKKFDASDGIFYQWVLSCGILLVGIVINIVRGCPQFYPLVMLGGCIWCLGNACVVSIVRTMGMGLGFCLWSVTNIISGWAAGRFGLFGTNARAASNDAMNYSGVALAALSAFVYTMIRPRLPDMELYVSIESNQENSPLINGQPIRDSSRLSVNNVDFQQRPFYERLPSLYKRIYGISLSLISGLLYGFSFTPSIYVQDNYVGASKNGLDYVLSQFTGTYLTSTFLFVVYTIASRNRPIVNNNIILPTLIGGIMWGIACSSWFVANQILSETISFPIICAGPTVVCNLITVFVFKEITGRRDLTILAFGFSVTITACVLTGLSI